DRLEAEHAIWKRNGKKADVDLLWVSKKDLALFDFLEERRTLTADKDRPNWFTTFTSSTDLKAALTKYFDNAFLPQRLADAIYKGKFPLFHVDVRTQKMGSQVVSVTIEATNKGQATALNPKFYFSGEEAESVNKMTFVAPNQTISRIYDTSVYNDTSIKLNLEYESMMGIRVIEQFLISTALVPTGIITGCVRKSQDFFR